MNYNKKAVNTVLVKANGYYNTLTHKNLDIQLHLLDSINTESKNYTSKECMWSANFIDENSIKYNGSKNKAMKKRKYSRREVILVQLGVNIGTEFSFQHDCIVLKDYLNHVTVLPITSRVFSGTNQQKWHFQINGGETQHIDKDCTVLLDQITTISKDRIKMMYPGKIKSVTMDNVEERLLEINLPIELRAKQVNKKEIQKLKNEIKKLQLIVQQSGSNANG